MLTPMAVSLQVAGTLAALVALNITDVNDIMGTLENTQGTSSLMRKANVYGFCTTSLMWHLRAYLKCVAIGENLPLHDLDTVQHLDHSYVYRRVHEQMGALAMGAHPFVLRNVRTPSA